MIFCFIKFSNFQFSEKLGSSPVSGAGGELLPPERQAHVRRLPRRAGVKVGRVKVQPIPGFKANPSLLLLCCI